MKKHDPNKVIDYFQQTYDIPRLKSDDVRTLIKHKALRKIGYEGVSALELSQKDNILKSHTVALVKTLCEKFNKPYLMIPCGKRKLTKEEATQAVAKAILSFNRKRKEQRFYHCSSCDAYHLSSKRFISYDAKRDA